jgi:hypothetical protein
VHFISAIFKYKMEFYLARNQHSLLLGRHN